MTPYTPIDERLKGIIARHLSGDSIVTDPATRSACAGDASHLRFAPELVIRAQSVQDIQTLMRLANTHRFPVTPRGGGSGLAGGCLPACGGVVLLMDGLDKIIEIDRRNLIMRVEPGANSQAVRNAAAAAGLFYPPDPAGMDQSTIGGNAATDAGGPACVKYGTTRDYILGLEAVLPDGERIATGVATRKGVVGYDLTNLLVGSEGTLGIITALILKLIPRPPAVKTMMVVFEDMVSAMSAVAATMGAGYLPSAIEFLDHRCLKLIGDMLPFSLTQPKPSVLIIEVDGPRRQVEEDMRAIVDIAREQKTIETITARTDEERERIWSVRRAVSLRIHDYAKIYIPEDIVVPITAIAELVDALPAYEARYGFEVFAFGHAGDGNIHLNITTQASEQETEAWQGTQALLELALRLKGTISGEHGIGLAKRGYISMELPAASIDLQKRIKALFDPHQVLNPGKIFP